MDSITSVPECRSFRLPRGLEILLGVVVALELIAPFVTKMYGMDARRHLLWISQFSNLLDHGILIPTWIPAGFGGFGSITFYFYPPLTYYLTAAIAFLNGSLSPTISYQAVVLLSTVASFFTARTLLKKLHAPSYQSTIGATLYAFAPLRLFEIYNRGALSTHVAYFLLPLVCFGVIEIYRPSHSSITRRVLFLGVMMSLLLLTSVPIALSVTFTLGIAVLVSWPYQSMRSSFQVAGSAVIAAALSAYHYAAVLSAKQFAHLRSFDFVHSPNDITLWFHPGAGSYNLLLLYGLAFVALWAYWKSRQLDMPISKYERVNTHIGLTLTTVVLFLDFSPLSFWLWNTWLLQLIQIPWRFYPALMLFIALSVGLASTVTTQRAGKRIVWICTLAALLPLAIILSSWHSMDRFPAEDDAYAPRSSALTNNLDTKPHSPLRDVLASTDLQWGEQFRTIPSTPYSDTFQMAFQTNHSLTFHRFYWPFWHLYANGREISSHPDSLGRAVAVLPAGNYTVVWRLERTPLEIAGRWISGVAWCGVLIFLGIGLVRRRVRVQVSSSP
jgi:hypothetical protein